MAKQKKFPKQLFVKIEDPGDGEFFFSPDDNLQSLAEIEPTKVAVYELKEIKIVKLIVSEV